MTDNNAEIVSAVRAHAEAHKGEPGWRGLLTYSDYELAGVLLVGCGTLPEALKSLEPIVAAYAGHEAAQRAAAEAAATEAP